MKLKAFAILALSGLALAARADLADDLVNLVGYTIAGSYIIAGYQDENGETSDDFEGCEAGRTIGFTNNKLLHCRRLQRSHYGYRPNAVIVVNGSDVKMIVGDDVFDMAP